MDEINLYITVRDEGNYFHAVETPMTPVALDVETDDGSPELCICIASTE